MNATQSAQENSTRYRLIGPLLWISTLQFFIAQLIASFGWTDPKYTWWDSTISELGAIHCGIADGRYMCSPLHPVMNVSFVLLGLAMAMGSVLIMRQLRTGRVGFILMAFAGLGAILVGLVPMDTNYWLHIVGADIAFLMGNIALIAFAFIRKLPAWLRMGGLILAVGALIGLYLFLSHNHVFGLGGTERIVAYPMVLWMMIAGIYLLKTRDSQAEIDQVSAGATP